MKKTVILTSLIFLFFYNLNAQIPRDKLVGFWPFNGNAIDESGNGNNGTVNGATLTTDRWGKSNSAYSFNGTDNYIVINNNLLPTQPTSYTLSVWIYPLLSTDGCIISDRSISSWDYKYFFNTNPLRLSMSSDVNTSVNSNFFNSQTINTNTWQHLVVVVDTIDNTIKSYFNGVLVETHNGTCWSNINASTYIGAANSPIGIMEYYFNGYIDDIRIYNRTLVQSEIDALFNESCNTTNSIIETACKSYMLNSQTYTSTGIYTQTLINAAGCDSTITLNLTISNIDSTVSVNENILTANLTEATYQWLDCNNNYAELQGETNQSFTATANGNYAVKISQNGCADTSVCFEINPFLGTIENNFEDEITLYQSLTDAKLTVDLGKYYEEVTMIISNVKGQAIRTLTFKNHRTIDINLYETTGIYFITLISNKQKATLRVIKN